MTAGRNASRMLALGSIVAGLVAAGGLLPLAVATHADGVYDIPLFFTWNRRQLDVLIVPPEHGQIVNGNGALDGANPLEAAPCLNSYNAAIVDSVAAWDRAIDQFAPAWLRDGLVINHHVLGCDGAPPTAMVTNPEIVIVTDQSKLNVLGVAVNTRPCLVDNSKFFITSFSYEDMYNVNGQEYGHCLGLDHVGGDHPVHDVMDGGYDDTVGSGNGHRHCVSNLDVAGLSGVFAATFNQPGGGQPGRLPVNQYQKIAC